MTTLIKSQVQTIAAYRVVLKRALRLKGVEFDNEAPTETLEALTVESNNPEETVTFGCGAPDGLAGKTFKAVKKVEDYESVVYGQNGMVYEKMQSVTYLIDGCYYGNECFIGK
jgi:hypothetical protein